MPGERSAGVVPERFAIDVAGARVQRNRLGLMEPGFEPQPRRAERARLVLEVFEQRPGNTPTTSSRDDIHALELSDVGVDEPHTTARDGLPGVPPEHENALWRREFGDRQAR